MPHTFCRRRSLWSAQACLRLLWKPDFSQQIVINQGFKAVASYRTPRRLRRGMQIICGIKRSAGDAPGHQFLFEPGIIIVAQPLGDCGPGWAP